MGRAKLKMELITKEKSRNITFKRRKEGLIRKMHEFSTLCDVSSCIIIYGPRNENGRIEPEIWPQNLEEIKRIIGVFKSKNKDSGYKSFGISDFFHDRNRKIEEELAKMKKKNLECKFPTWPDVMNFKSEGELRELGAALSNKLEHVKSRIEFLKRNRQGYYNFVDFGESRSSQSHMSAAAVGLYAPTQSRGVEMFQQPMPVPVPVPVPIPVPLVNQNSMMMMSLINENDDRLVQFDAGASASCKRQFFYESSMSEVVDPLLCLNTRPLARYYVPSPLPPLPSYMHVMPPVAPPPLHFSNNEE
ncbi:hypothetical protein C2S51_022734 [Perilla frutescens var. frutescens]|nr:hypothetical protein C2S51_022734 [Perilla frutescens var. frutescens]